MEIGIQVKYKNNNLLNAIKALGYENVSQFCKDKKLSAVLIGKYLNFKKYPRTKYSRKQICDAVCMSFDELFPPEYIKAVHDQFGRPKHFAVAVTYEQIENYKEKLYIDPYEEIEKKDSQKKLQEGVSEVLNELTDREASVLKKRFGLNQEPKTLEEVACDLDVTRERIRQLEAKALRKLRRPDRVKRLIISR